MIFQWSGIGLVIGAALGLLGGQLVFNGNWWATLAGAALGLVAGAVVDAQRAPRDG